VIYLQSRIDDVGLIVSARSHEVRELDVHGTTGSAAQPPTEIPLSPSDPVDRMTAPVIIA